MKKYHYGIVTIQSVVWVLCLFLSQASFAQKTEKNVVLEFSSGTTPYIVASPKTELQKRITNRLADYLSKVLTKPAKVVSAISNVPKGSPAVVLAIKLASAGTSKEGFTLETRKSLGYSTVLATGNTELGLKHAVQRLIIKSEQRSPGLVIPALQLSEQPWIQQREWTLCPWDPAFVRGVFLNPNADKRNNVWLYSDKQIVDYADMFDSFSFSGAQLLETVNSYSTLGSAEAFQDRLKTFALAADKNGQDVTLWVWAAQFNNFGWQDREVTYTPKNGSTAFTDPDVRATFEKYYDGYAKMAPYVDMLITHFYDPGQLKNRADVFNYKRLLQEKFKAKNPNIKFATDFWASDSDSAYMKELIDHGFGNELLLESSMPNFYPPGKREALHQEAKRQGIKMGVWGWHTMERETDQTAKMHVNTKVVSHFYKQIRDGVHKIQPITYWSEMEAYHLNNIFSAYSAGQLLWNPDRDPDEILREISEGIWGPRNGPKVLDGINLIQDVRSGPTWDTYWSYKGRLPYYLGTENPQNDLKRATASLADFESLKTDPTYVSKFPLPFPPATFIELITPHLKQIKAFAEFRIKEAAIREASKKGASKEELTRMAIEAWDPIPDYNTWIGTFGQGEARIQEGMMTKLAKDLDLNISLPRWVLHRDADRYLQKIQNLQKRFANPIKFKADDAIGKSEFPWTPEKIQACIDLLVEAGSLTKSPEKVYQLANWEHYKLR
jgi:hypothetical protein